MTSSLRTGALLVFDGDCGFCTTSVRWFERRFPDAFATSPYQFLDLDALGLTAAQCDAKVQWIGDVAAPMTTRREGAPGRVMRASSGKTSTRFPRGTTRRATSTSRATKRTRARRRMRSSAASR